VQTSVDNTWMVLCVSMRLWVEMFNHSVNSEEQAAHLWVTGLVSCVLEGPDLGQSQEASKHTFGLRNLKNLL